MAQFWVNRPGVTEELIRLWNEGYSATQCAQLLGQGLTRNACVAKIDRLRAMGVDLRAVQQYVKKEPKPFVLPLTGHGVALPKTKSPPRSVQLADAHGLEAIRLDNGDLITPENCKTSHCKWPYGEASDADFHFCGRPTARSSFCEAHAVICFQPKHPATADIEAA